jgi:hypothetical protein
MYSDYHTPNAAKNREIALQVMGKVANPNKMSFISRK